ncbi:hypothetical protein E3P89_03458 [Wallemia ichthyophaga]|uniref:Uncharacterized protein n=1 Tax=Wallemia ichthyophaga TaxID=245174 RepID=A0A4T0H1F6_WALIC|nr:hypothetical protein E3P93_03478 [Wallemia ichthyophaga]TIB09000.1 hypothetical protein E3P90_03455 [Wallemia ichthyophaga]TIB20039.1 hypothetical protein E3P89_03458 [Wallemia ichthyophaga]TIB21505.1 hypothetical protein E3P88_03470 [Wallemia ichthyophaga]
MHEMRLDVGLDAYEKSVSFDTDAYINDVIRPQVDGPDSLKNTIGVTVCFTQQLHPGRYLSMRFLFLNAIKFLNDALEIIKLSRKPLRDYEVHSQQVTLELGGLVVIGSPAYNYPQMVEKFQSIGSSKEELWGKSIDYCNYRFSSRPPKQTKYLFIRIIDMTM